MTSKQMALWANRIQRECLLEAGDDVDSGLAAAEIVLSTQPYQEEEYEDTGWVDVPDSFLGLGNVALAVEDKQPDIIIHNHVAAPIINVPEQKASVVNVAAPVVNMPEQKAPVVNVNVPAQKTPAVNVNVPAQKPPIVNVAAPVVHVAAPVVNIPEQKPAPQPPRKMTVKKNESGVWTGTVENA